MARLFVVATPIGNLGDITLRALETLKGVEAIACEDTRHTLKLLTHFGIRKTLLACHALDEERGAKRIVATLDSGGDVAFCSDAGTPALSDPGAVAVRFALAAGHEVVPIPGPSAFATLLSVAGGGGKSVLFEGFLSPKPGRRRSRVRELMERGEAFVLYESPYRVVKLLADIADVEPARPVVVGRELTKLHEELLRGGAAEVLATLQGRKEQLGEFSVLVYAAQNV
jgi:16S rRNA (cytidine1402-2'-O)-methyltransferase